MDKLDKRLEQFFLYDWDRLKAERDGKDYISPASSDEESERAFDVSKDDWSKDRKYTFARIFVKKNGNPIKCNMIGAARIDTATVTDCGGVIAKDDDYDVTFAAPDTDYELYPDDDLFSTEFIHKCVRKRQLLNVNEYRIHPLSRFSNPDVFPDILSGKKSRKDLQLKKRKTLRSQEAEGKGSDVPGGARQNNQSGNERNQEVVEMEEEVSANVTNRSKLGDRDDSPVSSRQRRTASRSPSDWGRQDSPVPDRRPISALDKRTRAPYRFAEKKKIVNYINDRRLYNEVKGTLIWKQMEEDNLLPSRTWQSMKEHFLKQIYPNIRSFGLSESEIHAFKKGYIKQFVSF